MPVTIGSNIESLRTQRQLQKATERIGQNFERLSSGLRINRASDDAAGLAISMDLRATSRVYTQSLRNVNDAVSLLNIADGAQEQLSNILIRIKELATQSASGSYSSAQRGALDKEGQALRSEFERIVTTTKFNDLSLLDGSNQTIHIQAGGNTGGPLTVILDGYGSSSLSPAGTGDGTFNSPQSHTVGSSGPGPVTLADLNGDGNPDLISSTYINNGVGVSFGNGDGTFQVMSGYGGGSLPLSIDTADFNSDGWTDVIAGNYSNSTFGIYLNNGDGTLAAAYTIATADSALISLADIDGNGEIDVVATVASTDKFQVFLGNGNGTFQAPLSTNTGGNPDVAGFADFNGDGLLDVVVADEINAIGIFRGNGDGTFQARSNIFTSSEPNMTLSGDFNGDGKADIAVSVGTANFINVFLGNGDGTFGSRLDSSVGSPGEIASGDFNGDGRLDLLVANSSSDTLSFLEGNGDGTFQAEVNFGATPNNANYLTVDDINNDGISDAIIGNTGSNQVSIFIGNGTTSGLTSTSTPALEEFSLLTRAGALSSLDLVDSALNNVSVQRGKIGASLSRLYTELQNLEQARLNYIAADSRITNADIAAESASLVNSQILQQVASSILAQANRGPELALTLLQN